MTRRARRLQRLLWKVVEFLSHSAALGWCLPPLGALSEMEAAEEMEATGTGGPDGDEPAIDVLGLDDWLDSVLGTAPPDPTGLSARPDGVVGEPATEPREREFGLG
jgi:hypothetical protein